MESATVLTGQEKIRMFQMRQQLSALGMELLGMKHSGGRSISKHIKDTHGIKGRKKTDVYKNFHALILKKEKEAKIPERPLTSSEKRFLSME